MIYLISIIILNNSLLNITNQPYKGVNRLTSHTERRLVLFARILSFALKL